MAPALFPRCGFHQRRGARDDLRRCTVGGCQQPRDVGAGERLDLHMAEGCKHLVPWDAADLFHKLAIPFITGK